MESELFTSLLPYIGMYVYAALFVWLVNAAVAGYNGGQPNREDFFQSVLWPVSIATLLGLIARVIVEILKEKKATKPAKPTISKIKK